MERTIRHSISNPEISSRITISINKGKATKKVYLEATDGHDEITLRLTDDTINFIYDVITSIKND